MTIAKGVASIGLRVLRPAAALTQHLAHVQKAIPGSPQQINFPIARFSVVILPPTPYFAGRPLSRQQTRHSSACSSTSSDAGGNGTGGGRGSDGGGGGGGGDGGSGRGKEGFGNLWSAYVRLLETAPVLTKALTAALMNAVGDLFAQVVIEKNAEIDWKRLGIFTVLGFALVAPALHFWYLSLSKLVTATGMAGVMLRLVLDQSVFAPAFIAVFFTALLTLEGKSGDIRGKLHQDWQGTVITNWKLWIPFQFLNFAFVPQSMQVLAANFVALIWNTYMSVASHTAVTLKPLV